MTALFVYIKGMREPEPQIWHNGHHVDSATGKQKSVLQKRELTDEDLKGDPAPDGLTLINYLERKYPYDAKASPPKEATPNPQANPPVPPNV